MDRRAAVLALIVASAAMPVGCALVFDVDALGPRAADDASPDATDDEDATISSPDVTTTSIPDATSDGRGPTGLSDDLTLPELGAAPCDAPSRSITSCGIGNACRFATPDSGRCEDCTPPRCTGNVGTKCEHSYDCDIVLTCFRGTCTLTCTIGEYECGALEDCLLFSYAVDDLGLCNPSSLNR